MADRALEGVGREVDHAAGLLPPHHLAGVVAHDPGEPVYEGDPPSDPVQTKLDLARAYIDIGDQVSAYEILGEVLKEGTVKLSIWMRPGCPVCSKLFDDIASTGTAVFKLLR